MRIVQKELDRIARGLDNALQKGGFYGVETLHGPGEKYVELS